MDFSLIGADDPTGPSPPPSRIALLILVHDARGVCFLEGWRMGGSMVSLFRGEAFLALEGEGIVGLFPCLVGGELSKDDADVN